MMGVREIPRLSRTIIPPHGDEYNLGERLDGCLDIAHRLIAGSNAAENKQCRLG